MDELSAKPLNQAHIRARKAAVALEKGDLPTAIALYREVNDLLRSARDISGNDEIVKRSIQLQIDDNEWKIRSLQLKDLAEYKRALGDQEEADDLHEPRTIRFVVEDEEDDGVVLISSSDHLDFFMDSLCPNATIIRQNLTRQDRLSDIPFSRGKFSSSHQLLLGDRLHRSPSLPENAQVYGKRLHKSDAQKEEEKSMLRMHHEIWSRQILL